MTLDPAGHAETVTRAILDDLRHCDAYGVVVGDPEATRRLREAPRSERPFFDRGPGYERLARG